MPRLTRTLTVAALFCAALLNTVTDAAAHSHRHPTQSKAHVVSKSSFHTNAGRVRDTHRTYEHEGESHLAHAMKARTVPLDQGVYLFEPSVYQAVSAELLSKLNSTEYLTSIEDAAHAVPEQIKIAVTQREGEMVVNWLTFNTSTAPTVQYGMQQGGPYADTVEASSITFVDPNTMHLIRFVHNALLTDLKPSTTYYYRVGDAQLNVWSEEQKLHTIDGSQVATLAVFGDMGVVNSQSMGGLSQEIVAGDIDLVLHVGDYAYNMDEIEGVTGDIFLKQMQNITSARPYMGTPGNHEHAFNFSHYAHKFSHFNYISNPAGPTDNNWWYSWDYTSGGASIHVLSLDSELYYYDFLAYSANATHVGNFQAMIEAQWKWIQTDLIAAYDSGRYDWIIAYAHRPMYCSNVDDVPDCSDDAERLRRGIPDGNGGYKWGFEEALGVRPLDIYFCAHEHSYERTLPVFNGKIDQQADPNYYSNPAYPVHIITGAGGCREYYDYYDEVFYGPWSVVRSSTYGYGHLRVMNSTHLYWEQLLDEGRGGVDPLWIEKTQKNRRATPSAAIALE